jgi:hypothetical protein
VIGWIDALVRRGLSLKLKLKFIFKIIFHIPGIEAVGHVGPSSDPGRKIEDR